MHVHLPKPLHGWREFFGEVGIIVVGVLIALGAEQIVEDYHWHQMTVEARESMDTQLADSKFAAMERQQISECDDRIFDRLDELLEKPQLPTIQHLRFGSLRTWTTSTWDAAVASGAVSHLDPETGNLYASAFSYANLLGQMNLKEWEISTDLKTLEYHRNIDSFSRDRLARDVSQLRGMNRMLKIGSQQWLDSTKALKLILPKDAQAQLAKPYVCKLPGDP